MKIAFINTANTFDLFYNGKSYSISKNDPRYIQVIEAIKNDDEEELITALSSEADNRAAALKKVLVQFPGLHIDGEYVTWNDKEIHGTMVDRMIENNRLGLPIEGIFKFIERVMKSENELLITDLYTFLEHGRLPITEDGTFYAYKVVRENFKDKYTGMMDNSPGMVVEIPRERVDTNRNNTCSSGLHFCSFEYMTAFYSRGDRIVKVEVAPEDVVSIPTDYNNTKARCCRYTVVEDVTDEVNPRDKETDILRVNGSNITDIVTKEQIRDAVGVLRKIATHLQDSEDVEYISVSDDLRDTVDFLEESVDPDGEWTDQSDFDVDNHEQPCADEAFDDDEFIDVSRLRSIDDFDWN